MQNENNKTLENITNYLLLFICPSMITITTLI